MQNLCKNTANMLRKQWPGALTWPLHMTRELAAHSAAMPAFARAAATSDSLSSTAHPHVQLRRRHRDKQGNKHCRNAVREQPFCSE